MFSPAGARAEDAVRLDAAGTPEGFGEIDEPRVSLVDLYYGGRKIGETLAELSPGTLRFRDPQRVIDKLPSLIDAPEVKAVVSGELQTHAEAACALSNASNCGTIDPQVLGIIYDAEHFRVNLFVNPRFLKTAGDERGAFLPVPDAPFSLTNAFGFNAAGTFGEPSVYHLQNRTILGYRNVRLRANSSLASRQGLVVDDFVAEMDVKALRFSAGLFWAPGNAFIGQRRILGAGVGTQFDTSIDEEAIQGTPLILFLTQPARVELLVDGRLMGSRSYGAGNNALDTSSLPSGSYPVLLRVREAHGQVREERRFFVKSDSIPPLGNPMFHAYGGFLANTRPHRPVSMSRDFYYQAGTAWRFTNDLAADVAVLGTQRKAIVEAGGWLIQGFGRIRAAGLVSSAGDAGLLLQGSSSGHGPLSVSFDVRRIWSSDGHPLIPLPSTFGSFDTAPATGVQLAGGSYTQGTASIGLRLGDAILNLVGSYRKDRKFEADYSLGPSLNWPVLTRSQMQIVLEASAQKTRTTTAGFAGLRLQLNSAALSMQSRVGGSFEDVGGPGGDRARAVTSMTAQLSHKTAGDALLGLEGGYERAIGASTARGAATLNSALGNLRAELLHNFEGRSSTQFDFAFQSGMAIGMDAAALGAREMEQSAMIVSVGGGESDAMFDVLVDEVVRGRIRSGGRLSLFVPAYRSYKVRVVPAAAASAVSYDPAAREVTLYPGNVRALQWKAERIVTIFAQAVTSDGEPITGAMAETPKGIAETDELGYFQVDVAPEDPIILSREGRDLCRVRLPKLQVRNDFASVGKVICE